jgi:hypothetical protein
MKPLFASLILLLGGVGGCATIHYRTDIASVPPREVAAIAVAPIVLGFPHRSYEPYEKTQNLVAELRRARIATIGPEEYARAAAYQAPLANRPSRGLAAWVGVPAHELVVLRAYVERAEENYRTIVRDYRDRPVDGLHLWLARYRIRLELSDLDGAVLARVTGGALEQRDDLAAATPGERYPKLREALGVMLRELLRASGDRLHMARAMLPAGLEVTDVHSPLMHDPAVRQEVAGLDPVARDVFEVVRYQYFDPQFEARWLPLVRRADGGALVRHPGPLAEAGVRAGDLITAVNEVALAGTCELARALARGPKSVTVLRGLRGRAVISLTSPAAARMAAAFAPGAPAFPTR